MMISGDKAKMEIDVVVVVGDQDVYSRVFNLGHDTEPLAIQTGEIVAILPDW